MIDWLRARMHVFPLIFLGLAVIALAVNWLISDKAPQDTLATVVLGGGAAALFVLKWSLLRKNRRSD